MQTKHQKVYLLKVPHSNMNIVLLEPEIPSNTGNIGRTCVATGSALHLIKPLGFSLDDKYIKRSGLDYWPMLDLHVYESFEEFIAENSDIQLFLATTKAQKIYSDFSFKPNAYIMFGKESAGIDEEILLKYQNSCMRIPMDGEMRSLNLSNSAAIILYEALRQNNFENMTRMGQLHKSKWKVQNTGY